MKHQTPGRHFLLNTQPHAGKNNTMNTALTLKETNSLNERYILAVVDVIIQRLHVNYVYNDVSAELAREALKDAKDFISKVEQARKGITSILDKQKKHLISREKELVSTLLSAVEAKRAELDTYLIEKRKAAELAQAQLAQNAQAAQAAIDNLFAAKASGADTAAAEQAAAEAIAKTSETSALAAASLTKLEGLSTRTNWDYKVIDLSRVPRQFLTLDQKALKSHLQQQRRAGVSIESVIIPGIQVFETTSTIIR